MLVRVFGSTYQVLLARAIVDFIDEDLKGVAGHNQSTQSNNTSQSKGDLEQLSLDALHGLIHLNNFASDRVLSFAIPLKLRSRLLDTGHTPDTPLHGKVDLLLLPVLEENDRPETTEQGIEERELAEQKPCDKAETRGDDEEAEVGSQEGEVEGNAFTKLVSNVVDVALLQDILAAPLLDPILVEFVTMQRKYGLNVFPLCIGRSNSSTTFVTWLRDHKVDQAQALCFNYGLILEGLFDVAMGG